MGNITLSHLADLIIVYGCIAFFSALSGWGLGNFIFTIAMGIRKRWRERRSKKEA